MVLSAASSGRMLHSDSHVSSDRESSLDLADLESTNIGTWQPLSLPANCLFGTDGIRGHAGNLLTASLAMQVGYWAGLILQSGHTSGPMILGRDSRNSGEMLSLALSAGLTAAGLDVWDIGLCPTPTVAYLAHATSAMGGVMVSASHNPPDDNGIKFFAADGTKLSTQLQTQIEAALRGKTNGSEPLLSSTADVTVESRLPCWRRYAPRPELRQTYLEALHQPLSATADLQGMRIVLDLAWGAAVQLAPIAFANLGADIICIHDQADGDRINVNCGSTHLDSLKAAVANHNADIGFAFDGDADRVVAVDSQGRVVDGDYILFLWGQALQRHHQLPQATIISTVMANLGFERAWHAQGGTLIRTAVGDQYVHAEMMRRGAVLGGEQSGHILCRQFGVSGDGILTALHLAALVQQSGHSLAELRDQSFKTYPQRLCNVRVEDGDRRLNWHESHALQQAIAQAETDMGDRGRVLVRASGTEPLIRVMVEAETTDLVQHWIDSLVAAVQTYAAT